MDNMLACETRYREHQQRMAWINENDWQFEKTPKRHPVRQAMAKALIALANAVTPTQREAGTA